MQPSTLLLVRYLTSLNNMSGKKHTIIWADDDADDLQLIKEAIEGLEHSFIIKEANNGKEAMDMLEGMKADNNLPCLVILDMNMPVMCGRKTLTAIKKDKELADVPVIIFTTSSSELDRMFCSQLGVDMVTKPTSFDNFKIVVNRLLSTCNQVTERL